MVHPITSTAKTCLRPLLCCALLGAAAAWAEMAPTPAPEDARVYIIEPQDGATVAQTFTVKFGLEGMGVAPAGIEKEKTGHHHLLINAEQMPAPGQPMGSEVKHFGGGQTQAEITLSPGEHTLQLVLGDHRHAPHSPPVISEPVTIKVK